MFKKMLFILSGLFIALYFTANSFANAMAPQLVKEKATAAAKLIEAEGEAAFAKIKDPKGEFRFADGQGYI